MNRIRVMVQALALSAAVGFAAAAIAQPAGHDAHPGGHAHGPGMMGAYGAGQGMGMRPGTMAERLERITRALGLSEEQRAQVAGIFEDTRSRNWDAIGQIQAERFKLGQMLRGEKVDADAAVEHRRKIDDLSRQVMRARLEARNRVVALLTPEQRERARSLWRARGMRQGPR